MNFSTIPNNITDLVHRFKLKRPTCNFKRWERPLFDQLVKFTNFLPISSSILQRLWHIEHYTGDVPVCIICHTQTVSWNNDTDTYRLFCSTKCSNKSNDVQQKRKQTMLKRYNVPYYTQASAFNDQRTQTYQTKYGTKWGLQNKHIREKGYNTCNQKYGNEKYTRTKHYRNKTQHRVQKTYGVDYISQIRILPESLQLLNDKDWLNIQHIVNQTPITTIGKQLKVDSTTVASYCKKHNIPITRFSKSYWETEIELFLQSKNIDFVQNDRIILNGKELDFFIPDFNIAIELCGLYWHADIHERINKHYHREKFELCEKQGIQLLTIFEDEWNNKKLIILSKLNTLLNKRQTSVFARNTKCCLITSKEKQIFFDTFHIQGNGPGSINIGLCYQNEIIAVMSLIVKKNSKFILNRYATSIAVVGGFSKLLKYFQRTFDWKLITTFADLRWSVGSLYETNQFMLDANLPVDYSYIYKGKRLHKFNFRRKHLQHMLEHFDPTLSEKQNCDMHNILRIWDCGKRRYVIQNKTEIN